MKMSVYHMHTRWTKNESRIRLNFKDKLMENLSSQAKPALGFQAKKGRWTEK